jgi:hypothetical protein
MVAIAFAVLLPVAVAVAVPATPAAAAEEGSCSAAANEPWLATDGWRIYVVGNGIGFCNRGGSAVEVLVKKDVFLGDPTYGAGVGQMGEWVFAGGVCDGNDRGNFYTEVRVGDVEVQSNRVRLDCG